MKDHLHVKHDFDRAAETRNYRAKPSSVRQKNKEDFDKFKEKN